MSQELNTVGTAVPGEIVVSPSRGHADYRRQPVTEQSEPAPGATSVSSSQDREVVEAAIQEANQTLADTSLAFSISVDGHTDQVVVQLTDRSTGEVVRQIPSEDQIAIAARLRELVGVLFNGQA